MNHFTHSVLTVFSKFFSLFTSLVLLGVSSNVIASTLYQPPGPNLTLGNVTHYAGQVSGSANPAAPAFSYSLNPEAKAGAMIAIGAGLEYGNVDDIFKLIDDLTAKFNGDDTDSTPGDGDPDDPGTGNPGNLPSNPTFDDIINNNPEAEQWIAETSDKLATLGATLAIVVAEGNAKAFLTSDIPILISNDFLGGSLIFSANVAASSKALGISDEIAFDADQARAEFDRIRTLSPTDPATTYNLSDGLSITVDPVTEDVDVDFINDSLLLTKASKIASFSFGYSRELLDNDDGKLFVGVVPKIYHVGLTQVDTRIGDITSSKELFDDIKNADFDYETSASIDVGALWSADNYLLGATLTDIFEPTFSFPDVDETKYNDRDIINRLRRESKYSIDRQLRLEASVFTDNRKWNANFAVDSNASEDPMGDEYQWLTVSGAYNTDLWWLSNLRLGYRENLAGTELKYLSAGMSFLKFMHFDIAATSDTAEIKGEKLPRALNMSLGFEVAF